MSLMNDQRLKRAIRVFTVDVGTTETPEPNGPAEEASARLHDELLNKVVPLLPRAMADRLCELGAAATAADADRLRELRLAAEEFFREDFRRPEGGPEAGPAPVGPRSEGVRATKTFEPRLPFLDRLEVWWTTTVLHRLERIGLREPTCYCHYGSFPGGDPRDFRPDPEGAASGELERHAAACAEWDEEDATGRRGPIQFAWVHQGTRYWAGALGTVLCEHHRRVPRPPPLLLRARRNVLRWFGR